MRNDNQETETRTPRKPLFLIVNTIIFGIALGLNSCKSVPAIETATAAPNASLEVIDARGAEVNRTARAIAAGDARKALLQQHLQALAQRAGPPLIANNDVRLLIDGPQTYDAIFSAIAQATRSVDVEVYIFDDDTIGNAMADLLKRKRSENVRVRLIYDSVGCVKTPRSLFDSMRDAGVQIVAFNPVNPLAGKLLDLNNRDHRKIVIVDDVVAYTGGINISSVYAHGSSLARKKRARSNGADESGDNKSGDDIALSDGWRDTQIEIRGPAVNALGELFDATWRSNGGESQLAPARGGSDAQQDKYMQGEKYAQGDKYVRVIGSAPDDKVNIIYADLLTAIDHAQRSIHITMSYFSPDQRTIEALRHAAQRGVQVQLVLPGFSDWWPVLEAGRSHYANLLDANIEIYEQREVFLHAKTVVIDGVWSTVGSSNMDMRSFLHNNEINVVVLGNEFGEAMEAMFANDRAHAQKIDSGAWTKRPLLARIKQSVARLFAYWL